MLLKRLAPTTAALSLGAPAAAAQTYPDRSVTLVVRLPPGGSVGSAMTSRSFRKSD